jgi:hypothetical protein
MSRQKIDAITAYLLENAGRLKFGTVSVTLKIHENRVVSISHETMECQREKEVIYETVC